MQIVYTFLKSLYLPKKLMVRFEILNKGLLIRQTLTKKNSMVLQFQKMRPLRIEN